ncbi:response regulator [uncultured Sulfitobacter sp.]|uniref:response regulator n=1 Tax=uncultured Sulfitobacter sp. TaxID=191468 RepID=UPI00260605FC|nr:response regulator [uncultured Sulfitobacter sp.]
MNIKTILVVEDEDRMITLLSDALEDWNAANEGNARRFDAIFVKSPEGAVRELYARKVDCALIDLRIPPNEGSEKTDAENGNALATALLRENGIPVAIISGHPGEAEPGLVDGETVRAFEKADDGYEDAVAWLASQWELMNALRAVRQKLERSTAEVFARRIWPYWSQIADTIGHDNEKLATAIARQYASHTAELLGQDGSSEWHPFENFIVPSYIADRPHTGDIFVLEGVTLIVLTPQCDMATGKVPNVLLAECTLGAEHWAENVAALRAATSNNKRKEPTKFLRTFVNQNLPASVHFLPPLPGSEEPVLVQFSNIRTMPLADLNEQLDARVASVSPPFLSNLVQRFGAFISRTGQPNIGVEHL